MGPKAFMGVYTGDRSHVKTPQPTPEEANTHRPDRMLTNMEYSSRNSRSVT